jgi:hypothetical protein
MRLRVKRTTTSPYAPYEQRCVYAVETARSCNASQQDQCIELELMMLDEDTPFWKWHKRYMAQLVVAREAARKRNSLLWKTFKY